jgi:3-hydroxyacyl-CoA dehydrogenase/enoyl-CoA hydratase/3-hydroxybutyryl-CoA epimerase/enoyl-CoA isomerase
LPVHDIFSFEDLDIPKVAAINGMALGGGFEMCLVCDYRVMSEQAQVGLPEIKLGIFLVWWYSSFKPRNWYRQCS